MTATLALCRMPRSACRPHNLEAEAAVLSATHRGARTRSDRVAHLLRPARLPKRIARIYDSALELRDGGRPPPPPYHDCEVLREPSRMQQVGGAAYLLQISDATPAVANIEARRYRRRSTSSRVSWAPHRALRAESPPWGTATRIRRRSPTGSIR